VSSVALPPPALEALERALRVSDQSCTAYAILRDRYKRWSTGLDLGILLTSAWLTAMVFVQPAIAEQLTPGTISKDVWLGLLSIGAFCLSLVQLQVNWKGRAQAYQQAATTLSNFVKELRPLKGTADAARIEVVLARYQALTESLEPIPESDFVKLKQRHKIKLEISRHLDSFPGTSIGILRIKLWWRDNLTIFKSKSGNKIPP